MVFKFFKTHISWQVLLAKFYLPYKYNNWKLSFKKLGMHFMKSRIQHEFQNIFHTFSFPRSQHIEFFDHNLFIREKGWKIFVGCNFPPRPFKIPTMITLEWYVFGNFTGTPHFTMEPRDVIITMGNTAYFSCRADGNSNYKISWLHNE